MLAASAVAVRYAKRPGSRIAAEDAQTIGEALAEVEERAGKVTPATVVEAAEDEENPLHGEFEWDDQKAGHAHRLQQARCLIRSIVPASDDGEAEVLPAWMSMVATEEEEDEEDGEPDQHRLYMRREDVMNDEDLRQRSLKDLVSRVYGYRAELGQYEEAKALVKQLDALHLKLDTVLW